jgi:hypothetical protein
MNEIMMGILRMLEAWGELFLEKKTILWKILFFIALFYGL